MASDSDSYWHGRGGGHTGIGYNDTAVATGRHHRELIQRSNEAAAKTLRDTCANAFNPPKGTYIGGSKQRGNADANVAAGFGILLLLGMLAAGAFGLYYAFYHSSHFVKDIMIGLGVCLGVCVALVLLWFVLRALFAILVFLLRMLMYAVVVALILGAVGGAGYGAYYLFHDHAKTSIQTYHQ